MSYRSYMNFYLERNKSLLFAIRLNWKLSEAKQLNKPKNKHHTSAKKRLSEFTTQGMNLKINLEKNKVELFFHSIFSVNSEANSIRLYFKHIKVCATLSLRGKIIQDMNYSMRISKKWWLNIIINPSDFFIWNKSFYVSNNILNFKKNDKLQFLKLFWTNCLKCKRYKLSWTSACKRKIQTKNSE